MALILWRTILSILAVGLFIVGCALALAGHRKGKPRLTIMQVIIRLLYWRAGLHHSIALGVDSGYHAYRVDRQSKKVLPIKPLNESTLKDLFDDPKRPDFAEEVL